MTNSIFKKTLIFSLLSHIAFFGAFNFSFGQRLARGDYAVVSFLGQLLQNSQTALPASRQNYLSIKDFVFRKPKIAALENPPRESQISTTPFLKPPVSAAFNTEKEHFSIGALTELPSLKRKEPVVILHPILPYSFALYFKDRQIAHVELMFKQAMPGAGNSALIKRKISSGNLEVDLLAMRYIGHYLFVLGPGIAADDWQKVSIDLSNKE